MSPYDGLSFSEKLKALRDSDPKFARSVARLRGAVIFLLAVTGFVAAMTANIVNVGQGHDIRNVHNDVTRIQKTPCGRHPANPSNRCEALRQALAASESIKAECIAHQRVEGTRGRNCPHVYVDLGLGGAPDPNPSKSIQGLGQGGDAQQTGSTGHQQPGPHHGGGGSGAGKGGHSGGHQQGHNPPSKSPVPTSEAESGGHEEGHPSGHSEAPAASSSPGNSESSKADPAAEGAGKAVESTGGTAAGVGKEASEGVNNAVGTTVERAGNASGCVVGAIC